MKNLLALVGLLVVAFAGLGWYGNWYAVRVQTGTDGKLNVSADVDQKKIGQDVGSFTEKAGRFLSDVSKPAAQPAGGPTNQEFVGPPAPPRTPPTGPVGR